MILSLLELQRGIYNFPVGTARFRAYLSLLTDPLTGDATLPLPAFNPMGKDHVVETLDRLIDMQAEMIAVMALEEKRDELGELPFQVGLVVADDRGGGWTNRAASEFQNSFRPNAMLKRGWAVVLLWTSERPMGKQIRHEVLTTVYRNLTIHRRGEPRTLGEILWLESEAVAFAGPIDDPLPDDEAEYTAAVLKPHLKADDFGTIVPALFGDEAAKGLGLTPLGLSCRAGLRLAGRWRG